MKLFKPLRRSSYLLAALLLLAASLIPMLSNPAKVHAGLPTARAVKMSSSLLGATSVTYAVSFTTATAGVLKSVAIDFCYESPIIGDACTKPTGFTTGTPTVANIVGLPGTWTAATGQAGRGVDLNNASNVTSVAASTAISFEITTITNPTDVDNVTAGNQNGTFYPRILTYLNATGADSATNYFSVATPTVGNPVDAGGAAIATADQITLQSKVQERITFCIYTSAANFTSCSGTTTTNPVLLGDVNGVLSTTQPSISKTAKYNITTNAVSGATIRAKGATLTSGALTISPVAAGAAAGAVYAADTEQYGFCTYRDTGGGAAGLTPHNDYDGDGAGTTSTACTGTTQGQGAANANGATFTFDTVTAADNITTLYGDTIATKSAGSMSTGILTFLGGVNSTTEPGIYTSTMMFIATGTY